MDDDERHRHVKRQVRALRDFYLHLAAYLVVNVVLLLIDLATSPGHLWFYWPLLGWGIAVALHGFSVVGGGLLGREWQERKAREIMARRRASAEDEPAPDQAKDSTEPRP